MLAEYLVLSVLVSAVFCLKDNFPLLDRSDGTEPQEGFPGHVALRPDYTFWNMMRMLRRMFDSNPERRVQRELPLPFRDLRSRRMLLNFSNAY